MRFLIYILFSIAFLNDVFAIELKCNQNLSQHANVKLDVNESFEINRFNSFLNDSYLSLSEEDYVVVQNISLGSDSINITPKLNDPEYANNILKNIVSMQEKIKNGAVELPPGLSKDSVIQLQDSYKKIITKFTNNTDLNKNWTFFNSFLYYNNIRFEAKYKYTQKCGMSLAEISAITCYTGGLYKYINRSLRNDVQLNSLRNLSLIFNNGLDKLESYIGNVTRGASLSEPYLSQHAVGKTVLYKGLTSTSNGVPFAGDYSFSIESKTGKDISLISMYPDEKEVLFKPNTRFLIKNKTNNLFEMVEQIAN
jgi:hypothetical protein